MPPPVNESAIPLVLPTDTTSQTELAARDVLDGRHKGLRAILPFAGPAVIASVGYMDPGNIAVNIQAGSTYGYELLWVVLAASLVAMLFQAMSAKLGIVTGRNLAQLCREQLSRPIVMCMWIASEIAAMATDVAEFVGGAVGSPCCFTSRCSAV
jgi:manganese transport protein